jgi:beta-glucosidase
MFGVRTKIFFRGWYHVALLGFPEGFLWGAATSALQIEGSLDQDGRGESIWDRFAAAPGNIADGSSPAVACDHYRRWSQDIALMGDLGLGAYRFSIAWPRIQPTGRGPANDRGLDFYDRLVDGLLAAGIQPFPTLYHWDLPQVLQDEGGWGRREIVEDFAGYARLVSGRLGDRVRCWTTHNEPWCIATLGHEEGHHAPGHKDPQEALRVAHHLLLSHGLAAGAIRGEVPGAQVGIVMVHCPSQPATESPADREASRWFDGFFNRWYLDPIFRGTYPADAVDDRVARGHLPGPDLPFVQAGDMQTIAAPLDFLGLNYYSRNVMRSGDEGRPQPVQMVPDEELTDMGWEVYPEGLYQSLVRVHRDYRPRRILVTENGAAYDDPAGPGGGIQDSRRIAYLQGHLLALHRAVKQGVPVDGYFAWSLLDNFEWALGFAKKFGLYAVDADTLERRAKASALWYRQVALTGSIDDRSESLNRGETRARDD